MSKQLIFLRGLQGAGKSAAGNYLQDRYGFVQLSFASVLKDVVALMFRWDRALLEGITEESRVWREQVDPWWAEKLQMPQLTPRYILQTIGTDVFRTHFHRDFWLLTLERKIMQYDRVVITDCRFRNEFNFLKNLGGICVWILRDQPKWLTEILCGKEMDWTQNNVHPSEREWCMDPYDYIIWNNSPNLSGLESEIFHTLGDIIQRSLDAQEKEELEMKDLNNKSYEQEQTQE